MAQKFHITPDGPKRCTATIRRCPYQHYNSKSEASQAFQEQQKDSRNKALVEKIRQKLDEPKSEIYVNMNNRGDYGRALGTKMMFADTEDLQTPDLVSGQVYGDFSHPESPINVEFAAVKNYQIQGKPPRIIPHWRLTLTKNSPAGSEVIADENLSLSTAREGQEIKTKAHSYMQNAASQVNANDLPWQKEKVSDYYDSFVNSVKAVESTERGGYGSHLVGFGYFEGSTPETIHGRIDFSETAFTGREVEDIIKSDTYENHLPNVDILIQDSNAKRSNAWWAAHRDNNGWKIYLHKNDGKILASEYMTSKEFKNKGTAQIASFSSSEMNYDEGKRDNRSLVSVVMAYNIEKAFANHAEKVEKKQEENRERNSRKEHQNLYKPNSKKTGLDKVIGFIA